MTEVGVVYKTKYGSSEQYAEWLGKSLKCDVYEMSNALAENFKDYKTLIVMSGVYGGRMPLLDFLKRNWNKIKGKRIIIVVVGALPENHLWSRINYFFLPSFIKKGVKYFKIYGKPPRDDAEPVRKSNLDKIISFAKK